MLFLVIYLSDDRQITIILLIYHLHSNFECLILRDLLEHPKQQGLAPRAVFLYQTQKVRNSRLARRGARSGARKSLSFQYSSHTEWLRPRHRSSLDVNPRHRNKNHIKQSVAGVFPASRVGSDNNKGCFYERSRTVFIKIRVYYGRRGSSRWFR